MGSARGLLVESDAMLEANDRVRTVDEIIYSVRWFQDGS